MNVKYPLFKFSDHNAHTEMYHACTYMCAHKIIVIELFIVIFNIIDDDNDDVYAYLFVQY